jgi:hypothetical protein
MSKITEASGRALRATNNHHQSKNINQHDCDSTRPNGLIHPNADGINVELQAAVQTLQDANTPVKTRRVAIPKMEEFFEFCDYLYGHQPNPRHLTPDKAYRFMFYLAFREKKLHAEGWVLVPPDDLIETSITGLWHSHLHLVQAILLITSHNHEIPSGPIPSVNISMCHLQTSNLPTRNLTQF